MVSLQHAAGDLAGHVRGAEEVEVSAPGVGLHHGVGGRVAGRGRHGRGVRAACINNVKNTVTTIPLSRQRVRSRITFVLFGDGVEVGQPAIA